MKDDVDVATSALAGEAFRRGVDVPYPLDEATVLRKTPPGEPF